MLPLWSSRLVPDSLTGQAWQVTAAKLTRITSSRWVGRPGHPFCASCRLPTPYLLLLPIHLERAHSLARLVLPSSRLVERTHQLDPELGVAGKHLATHIGTHDQPHLWHEVAGLQLQQQGHRLFDILLRCRRDLGWHEQMRR